MQSRDYRDISGGLLMIGFGAFVAYYSSRYDMGTFRRMGPGMFPSLLGYALCVVGALILVPAFYKRGAAAIDLELRSFAFVIGALATFAVTVSRFGIVPAVVAMTLVASAADGRLKPLSVHLLAGALSAVAVGVFHYALGTALVPFRWPY